MNKKLLTAVVGAALASVGSAANAIDLKISGGLHRAVVWADDGGTSQLFHADPTTWPSRLRFLAQDDLVAGVKVGVNWEVGYNSNRSNTVSQNEHSDPSGSGISANPPISERWQEIWFSGAIGKLAFGQGNTASKDGNSVDLSNTDLFNGGQPGDIGAGLLFRDSSGALTSIKVGDVITAFEGTRTDRIRYDSPAIGPVVFSAASGYAGNSDWTDFAVRINSDLGAGGKLAAAIYYNRVDQVMSGTDPRNNGNGLQENQGFSASWLSPMGLNVTAAYSTREDENPTPLDAKFMRLKVGYIAGEHAVSLGYAKGEKQIRATPEADATNISVAYNWRPKPWADIYVGVETYGLDHPTISADDIMILAVGSRITF
jgi:predicted porin